MRQMALRQSAIMRELTLGAQDIGFRVAGDAKANLDARPPAPSADSRMPAKPRTHRLSRAITSFVEATDFAVRSVIGVLATVAYGRIQEQGGVTSPHLIRPRYKKALRWVSGRTGPLLLMKSGKPSRKNRGFFVFAKLVHHPGSRIPARPFIGPAVTANLGFIEDRWREAVRRGLRG